MTKSTTIYQNKRRATDTHWHAEPVTMQKKLHREEWEIVWWGIKEENDSLLIT
jgi:hypothetical protein